MLVRGSLRGVNYFDRVLLVRLYGGLFRDEGKHLQMIKQGMRYLEAGLVLHAISLEHQLELHREG